MRKIFAIALTAAALFGGAAATATDAEARHWHRGYGIGFNLGVFGVGIGHAYSQPYYVRRCGYVERYDRHGNYIGTRRVCNVMPY